MSDHMASTSRWPLRRRKLDANFPPSVLILRGSALFQMKSLRLVCLRWGRVSLFLMDTASWSETPEITSVDLTKEG